MKITHELIKVLLKDMKKVVAENKGTEFDYVIILNNSGLKLAKNKNQHCLLNVNETGRYLRQLKYAKENGQLTGYSMSFPRVFMRHLEVENKNPNALKEECVKLHKNLVKINKELKTIASFDTRPIKIVLDDDAKKRINLIQSRNVVKFDEEKNVFTRNNFTYWESLNPTKAEMLSGIEKYLSLDDKISLLYANIEKGVLFLEMTAQVSGKMNGENAVKVAKDFNERAEDILEEFYYVLRGITKIARARKELQEYKNFQVLDGGK